ncbi:MAG TPA: nitroreductase family deazaflavin-dependent oxidoreductase [Acidimicrobiales bacterium]
MSAAHSAQPRSGSLVAEQTPRLGRRMARFNRAVVNPVAVHVAGLVPGVGVVTHVGRRSRTVYRNPVLVFRTKDGYRIALVYGRDADWVKNALAHGAVRLTTLRKVHELSDPEIVTDPHHQHVPAPGRLFLRVLRVSDFIDFHAAR